MYILTIETTCDETAAAVITDTLEVRGAIVASQDRLHERFGGVVPEIASRAHVERILPVIDETLREADIKLGDLDAVAVAHTPGLVGSLLVGVMAAKTLAMSLGVPLVGVNHLQAHIYACRMADGPGVFPCLGLIVSGGHTNLYRCDDPLTFNLLGSTIDDAAGEAFDKVASMLGLPYPGGPAISRAAATGDPNRFDLPRAFAREPQRLAFSFSGLKTAVRYQLAPPGSDLPDPASLDTQLVADLAASFEEAAVDALVTKTTHALDLHALDTLCVGGGVAANTRLRERLAQMCDVRGARLHVAPLKLCTDNAVMGAIAVERLLAGQRDDLDLGVSPAAQRVQG